MMYQNNKFVSFLEQRKAWLTATLLVFCVMGYPAVGLLAATTDWSSRCFSVPFRFAVALLSIAVLSTAWRSRPLGQWSAVLGIWLALYSMRLTSNVMEGHPGAMYEIALFCLAAALPVLALMKSDIARIEPRAKLLIIWLATAILSFTVAGEYLGWFLGKSYTFTGRLSTITVNPITLGHVAASLILTLVVWRIQSNRQNLLILMSLVSLGLISISYAGSRGPFAGLIVALTVLVLATPRSSGQALVNRLLIVALIGLSTWVMWHPIPIEGLIGQSAARQGYSDTKIQSILAETNQLHQERASLSDESSMARQELLKRSLRAFLEKPIFGVSNFTANQGQYPHNLILEAFQNLGIAGGGIFLVLIVVGSYRAYECIRSGQYLVPCLFIQALVGGQFSGSLYASAQLWTTLAVLLASSASTLEKSRRFLVVTKVKACDP